MISSIEKILAIIATLILCTFALSEADAQTRYYAAPYTLTGTYASDGKYSSVGEAESAWWVGYHKYWIAKGYYGRLGPLENNCSYNVRYRTPRLDDPRAADFSLTGYCGGGNSANATAYFYDAGKNLGDPKCCGVGDPINIGTGNEFQRKDDFVTTGSLRFTRYYNSHNAVRSSNLGPHWRHNFDRRIDHQPDGTNDRMVMNREDGAQITFRNISGNWAADADIRDRLTAEVNSADSPVSWTYFVAESHVYETYSAEGLLTKVTDADGQVTSLTYSTAATPANVAPMPGLLILVTDPKERQLSFIYSGDAKLSQVVLPDGGALTYAYDQASNIIGVTYPDQSTITYAYNEPANVGAALPFALTGIFDETGSRFLDIKYDKDGKATFSQLGGISEATQVAYGNSLATVKYATGVQTTFGLASVLARYHIKSGTQPCQPACNQRWASRTFDTAGYPSTSTDFLGRVTSTTFSNTGLLTHEVEAQGTADQRVTDTTWNPVLRVPQRRAVTDNAGRVHSVMGWDYNAVGQVTASCAIDPLLAGSYACAASGDVPPGVRRTTYTYCTTIDPTDCPLVGLLLATDGPRLDVSDRVIYSYFMTTDEAGCETLGSACQHAGDLASVIDGAGLMTTYLSYDKTGRITRSKDPNGVLTDYTYTRRGWLATTTVRANPSGTPSSEDAITTIAYEPTGMVRSVTDADGVKTTYTYDSAHRLTDITDGGGGRVHYTLDAAGNKTAEQVLSSDGVVIRSLGRSYNSLSQLTSLTDGLNRTVFSASFADSYDGNGNLVHSQDGLGVQQKHVYDGLNRLISTLQDYQGGSNTTSNAQSVTHLDALDRVRGFSDPDGLDTTYEIDALGNVTGLHSPDTGTTTHGFDLAGNPTSTVDAANEFTAKTFDTANRLTATTYADSTLNVTYKYDEPDSVTGCTGGFGRGRVTRIIEGTGGLVYCYDQRGNLVKKEQTVGEVTTTTSYSWTLGNRLSSVTTANGARIAYARDTNGRVVTVTATPSGGTTTTVASEVIYRPFGPIASYNLGNGQAVTRSYDANGQLTDITSQAFALHLARDVMGNVTAIGDTSGVATPTETYSYDPLYRLRSISDADGQAIEEYTYSRAGDRLSKTAPGILTGIYNYKIDTHQLIGVGTTTRQVDARGNMTANVGPSGSYGFGYNQRNRLSVVRNGGTTVGSYILNALGQRVQKTTTSGVTRFDYDEASHLLSESAGNETRDYVWLDDLPVGIVDRTNGTSSITYIHADGLESPRAVTDTTGKVLWRWPYNSNPFGEKAPASPTGYVLNLRFPGQYFDAESGLSYNGNRDYEPATGRYMQSDPIGLVGGTNTYGYVDQNPFGFVDPLGLQAVCLACHNGVLPGFPGPVPMPPPADSLPAPGVGAASDAGDGVGDATKPDTCPPDKPCPPCRTVSGMIIPVGTIGYRLDILPDNVLQHGIYGSHYNLYKANQAPRNSARPCKCFWQPIGAVSASNPVFGSIPIEAFAE